MKRRSKRTVRKCLTLASFATRAEAAKDGWDIRVPVPLEPCPHCKRWHPAPKL